MKVLILGAGGMLGHKLYQVLRERFDVRATLRTDFSVYKKLNLFNRNDLFESVDIYDFDKIEKIIKFYRPDAVINAVGIIKQIPDASDVIKTLETNSIFPQKLALTARSLKFRFINISTDCVFDGKKGFYTEEDLSNALDLYGRSKSLGETVGENCLTVRTSIIGREIYSRRSLIEWFISNRGGRVKGFKKAIYSGFPTVVLARILGDIIENLPDLRGLYHVSSEAINKFDLLKIVNKAFDLKIEIEADEDFVMDRSLDSGRFRRETGFVPQNWEEMISIMAADPTPYDAWKKIQAPND